MIEYLTNEGETEENYEIDVIKIYSGLIFENDLFYKEEALQKCKTLISRVFCDVPDNLFIIPYISSVPDYEIQKIKLRNESKDVDREKIYIKIKSISELEWKEYVQEINQDPNLIHSSHHRIGHGTIDLKKTYRKLYLNPIIENFNDFERNITIQNLWKDDIVLLYSFHMLYLEPFHIDFFLDYQLKVNFLNKEMLNQILNGILYTFEDEDDFFISGQIKAIKKWIKKPSIVVINEDTLDVIQEPIFQDNKLTAGIKFIILKKIGVIDNIIDANNIDIKNKSEFARSINKILGEKETTIRRLLTDIGTNGKNNPYKANSDFIKKLDELLS